MKLLILMSFQTIKVFIIHFLYFHFFFFSKIKTYEPTNTTIFEKKKKDNTTDYANKNMTKVIPAVPAISIKNKNTHNTATNIGKLISPCVIPMTTIHTNKQTNNNNKFTKNKILPTVPPISGFINPNNQSKNSNSNI